MSTTIAVRRVRSTARAHPSLFLAVKAALAAMLAWLVVQPLGDFASGYAYYAPSGNGYYTAKYAALDGAVLWEQRYDSPQKANYGQAVAVAANGDVVVSGASFNANTSDFATLKYSAGDGAMLWVRRYDGLASANDIAQAVVIDNTGNVIVAGSTRASDFADDTDIYAAKYAPNGSLIWQTRYDGPGHRSDTASALAFGPSDHRPIRLELAIADHWASNPSGLRARPEHRPTRRDRLRRLYR